MLKTALQRILTPPPVPVSPSSTASSATAVTSQALTSSLYLSASCSASPSLPNTRMRCVTPHPSLPQIAYVLDLPDQKLSPQRQLIVQHTTTCQVLWKCSMGDLCEMLFEFDVRSSNGPAKQAAALGTLRQVQRLDFFDSSTLHATDMGESHETLSFQYLMVQLPQRIVILNLRVGPNSHALSPEERLANPRSPYHFIVGHIIEENVKAATSMAVPLTSSLLVIGCADGALRVYDFKKNKVVKSIRGPDGKNSIQQLLAANAANKNTKVNNSDKRVKRLLAIGKKGAVFLWEVVLQKGTLIDVRPPLVRMDVEFGSDGISSSLAEQEGGGEASGSLEHTFCDYDAHRNLFLWLVPDGYKGSHKAHVLMWDLNTLHDLKRKKNVTPKLEPIIGSIAHLEGPLTLVPGWLHPAFPANTLTCAVATLNGELHVVCVPISDAKPGSTVKAIPFFSDNLGALIQRDAGMLIPPKVRVQSITTFRRLDTSTLLIGSSVGLLMVSVNEAVCSTGARHAYFGAGMADWSNSVLTVDNSTLVWAQLDIPEINPCGKVLMKNPTLVYKSPPALHLPPEIRERAVRLPPRFLPSPSGNFLCLYWQDELKYEILHLASILRRNDGSYSPAVSSGSNVLSFAWVGDDDVFALLHPAMEVRTDGTPTFGESTRSVSTASTRDTSTAPSVVKASGARGLRKSFIFMNKPASSSAVASSIASPKEEYSHDASRHAPRVELKVLVPVGANAAQISGSNAAATATILGDISLRGGNRSPPTMLFSGPILCVASKIAKESDGGTAYF